MRAQRWIGCLLVAMVGLAGCAGLSARLGGEASAVEGFRQADMTVVVSARQYFASARTSYYHLYLYSGDGVLVRQLTDVDGMSYVEPVLSPDANQVCFRRYAGNDNPADASNPFYEKPYYSRGDQTNTTATYCLIADVRAGSAARRIAKPPDWYWPNRVAKPEGQDSDKPVPVVERFVSPDGVFEIVLDHSDEGRVFFLVDRRTSETLSMAGQMANLETTPSISDSSDCPLLRNAPYLCEGSLRLAFFRCHLGSANGNSHYACDLDRRVFTGLAPSGGFAASMPKGVPGFFFVCQERYQDLGYGSKSVNCDYLDFWDAGLKRTRFAQGLAKFGGAAAFVPGYGVTTIPPDLWAQ